MPTMTLAAPVRCSSTGRVLWERGELTAYGEEVYTEGDCWGLAWAIAEVLRDEIGTGRIVLLGSLRDWWHVAVKIDDDQYLDAHGLHTKQELSDFWGRMVMPLHEDNQRSFAAYQSILSDGWVYPSRLGEATAVAVRLIEEHCSDFLFDI